VAKATIAEKRAVCPECLKDESGFGELDVVQTLALFTPKVTKRGRVEIVWAGSSEADWDSQREIRPRTFMCQECGHLFRKFKIVDADFDPNAAAFDDTAG